MLATIAKYAIQIAPDSAASSIVRALATRTKPAPVSAFEQDAMAGASKLTYGEGNSHAAWAWGEGPLVIFVHGWGGRAAQMAPLAAHVARLGFRSVAIDVTGHGDSPVRHTKWAYFMRDIAALSRSLGQNVHAYVGHSAGGLTMMAARKINGIRADRYVCICSPSHPFPPIVSIQRKLNPRKGVLERYQHYIALQFETDWDTLRAGCAFANAGSDLLLCYDEADRFISHGEGDRIQALCPGAQLVKTRGFGHLRVLAAPELAETVGAFLAPAPHTAASRGASA